MKPSKALKKLRWFWNRQSGMGICYCFRRITNQGLIDTLKKHNIDWANWAEYSSEVRYPVPHPKYEPLRGFRVTSFMFNPLTKYGRSRRRLLEWLIKEFEKKGL